MSVNRLRKLSKKLAILLIFVLSINNMAAIVSDNDGSAFVTKSEFEALKKNFADQITNYNNSIDEKIDGAIAAYLAGLKLKKNEYETLPLVSSVFEYPLDIYMNNTEFNVTNYNNGWLWSTCWKPNYDWNFIFQRGSNFGQAHLSYSNSDEKNNKLTWFFKGARDGDKYKITQQLNDYSINLSGSMNLMNTTKTTTGNLSAAVFMDQTSKGNENYKQTAYTRSSIRNDYSYNFLLATSINSNKPIVEFVDNWGQTNGPSLSNSTKYYQYVTGDNLYIGLTNASSDWFLGECKYTNKKVNKMFMYSNANNAVRAPVTWGNNDLYITNQDRQKQDVTRVASATLYSNNSSIGNIYYIRHVVDPGWCIEPESYGSTGRAWYYKSLIDPKRLVYDYTKPQTQTLVSDHYMIKGIPLTETPKKTNGVEFAYINVKFNLTRTQSMKDAKVYPTIIFFDEPNEEYDLSKISGDKYYDIATMSTIEKTVKKVVLNDGANDLYVTVKSKGSSDYSIKEMTQMYYKILWNSNQSTNCSISEPTVQIMKIYR